jgi:C-terminal processing protease CtpA/Prc
MKFLTGLLAIFLICSGSCLTQAQTTEIKYSALQLREDLDYLKHLIINAHVNPNSELSPRQYKELFSRIELSLKDSASAGDFLKKIKPVIAYLSDEHSQINLKSALLSTSYRDEPIYLPFTLMLQGENYVINTCLESKWGIIKGQVISSINGMPVKDLVEKCALATTGFPGQRIATALRQFGYLYPWASDKLTTRFTLKTKSGKVFNVDGTTLKIWEAFLATQADGANCEERLSYTRYGDVGYLNACSFDAKPKGRYSLDSIKYKIDIIFKQIRQDGVKKLVLDVSHNEGGNSGVGDYLISYIYGKPYMDYQTNWKRSDEYLKLLKSWGIEDPAYAAEPVGKILHYPSEQVVPEHVPYPFAGKTVIVIGRVTFSSAMTFATLIRDNRMAKLIGQTPVNGHPNGFGEMYYTNLPHTQIFVRFGVKEHIRPAGKLVDNQLKPDVMLTDTQMKQVDELLKQVD